MDSPIDNAFRVFDRTFDNVVNAQGEVNAADFSAAWEMAGGARPLALAFLARKTLAACLRSPDRQAEIVANAADFLFVFMNKRHIGFGMDLICAQCSAALDVKPNDLIGYAALAKHVSPAKMEAAIHGASGLHYYRPSEYALFDEKELAEQAGGLG